MSGEEASNEFDGRGHRPEIDRMIDKNLRESRTGNIDTGLEFSEAAVIVDFDSVIMGMFGKYRIAEAEGRTADPITTVSPLVSAGTRLLIASVMEYGMKPVFISARPERQRDTVARIIVGFIPGVVDLRMLPGSGPHSRQSFKRHAVAAVAEQGALLAYDNVREDEGIYGEFCIDVVSSVPYSLLSEGD